MAPRHADLISSDTLYSPRRRMNNPFQRISPRRSLLSRWRRKSKNSEKGEKSASLLPKEQPAYEESIETNDQLHVSDLLDEIPAPVMEITVIGESSAEDQLRRRLFSKRDRLGIAEAESREYLEQLNNTKKWVDSLTRDLIKSKNQTSELINHNSILFEELKATAGQDEGSHEAHRIMKQELNIMKGWLFSSAIFLFCGGRSDILALVSLAWMILDVLLGWR